MGVCLLPVPARQAAPIFVMHTDEFWLNLHHFLYVLGRAEAKAPDASRAAVAHAPEDEAQGLERASPSERAVWRKAVTAYAADLSKRDLVFDAELPELTLALAEAGEASRIPRLFSDSTLQGALQRAAPIYRKLWWPEHRAGNRRWRVAMDSLVARHGPKVLAFIQRAYQLDWPGEGFPVHVAGYANWAGAYSTNGTLLVIASRDSALAGLYGLETLFHEAMHQWDGPIDTVIDEEASRLGKPVPPSLSHGMIFFTAGEAIRQIAPDHVPYADAFGVWQRRWQALRAALLEIWKPYLDGAGTRDETILQLLIRLTSS